MMRALVLAGPTGVGKSRIAIETAAMLGGEIISADSRQIYRSLKIGTDRVDASEMKEIPHHLMGFVDPSETYSAGRFAREASAVIEEVCGRNRVPLVCGGTGFYIKSLLEGLFDEEAAEADRDMLLAARRELEGELTRIGPEVLHQRLESVDPEAAARIHPHDSQRIVRALEIYEATGRPLSYHQHKPVGRDRMEALKICLTTPREKLYSEIDLRVERMFEKGLVEEVQGLLDEGYGPDAPAFESLGYREVVRYIEGSTDLETAVREIKRGTRRYAKRQLTWLGRQEGYRWITVGEGCVDEIVSGWQEFDERIRDTC